MNWDWLRYVIVFGWFWELLLATFAVFFYVFANKTDPRREKRLMINHLIAIGISHITASTVAVYETFQRLGQGFTAYLVLNFVIVYAGIYGLGHVMVYERNRVNRLPDALLGTSLDRKD